MSTTTALTTTGQIVSGVIDRVLDGCTLRDALKSTGLTPQSFGRLLQQDREAAAAYARASELRADLLADEIISIADSDGDTSKARNQIQARQWLASKLNTKRYGDRIDLNVTQTIDIGSTLAEARARLLPPRYLGEVTDAETRMLPSVAGDGPSDIKSLAPAPDDAPDIFT